MLKNYDPNFRVAGSFGVRTVNCYKPDDFMASSPQVTAEVA